MKQKNQYQQLGVSSSKEDVHAAIKNLDKGLFPGSFCKIFPDTFTNSKDHCIVAHADGVGTKSALAYLYWKETGDISVFRNLAIDAIVMNLDDMICVGATGPFTFTQNIDRNSFAIPGEVIEAIIEGTKDFFEKMRAYNIDITYNGGETADVNDLVRTLTLNASMQARMLRTKVIPTEIKAGDVVVGLASYGKAMYEDQHNSGIGSNGLTMTRHKLFSTIYKELYPDTYDHTIKAKAYSGVYEVEDIRTGAIDNRNVGQYALSPTRTYAPIIKEMLKVFSKTSISAMIHCSGGGQTKSLGFANGVHIIKDSLFDIPSIFTWIQEASGESWENMYKAFNMGSRFEVYCKDDEVAQCLIETSNSYNVAAKIIGHVEACDKTKLTIKSPYGEFVYTK